MKLKDLITMITHVTYKDDYKCVKEIEIGHVGKNDHKEKAQESILKLNRKLIDSMHTIMNHKLLKEREIKLKYLEMFHFQSKKLYSLKQNKPQLKLKKGNKHKKGKGNEPFSGTMNSFCKGKDKNAFHTRLQTFIPCIFHYEYYHVSLCFLLFCGPTLILTFPCHQSVTHMFIAALLFISILNTFLLVFIAFKSYILTWKTFCKIYIFDYSGVRIEIKQPKMVQLISILCFNYNSVTVLSLAKTTQKGTFLVNCGSLSAIKQPEMVQLISYNFGKKNIERPFLVDCHLRSAMKQPKKCTINYDLDPSSLSVFILEKMAQKGHFFCCVFRLKVTVAEQVFPLAVSKNTTNIGGAGPAWIVQAFLPTHYLSTKKYIQTIIWEEKLQRLTSRAIKTERTHGEPTRAKWNLLME
ncbi:hypothetical protein VP01_1673g1 [Puccinia sorghi]|uniref:Uncharacterized protein n=1 Tax=Puccinia sorghi TaxID=27349 RepID=A0A0L6VHX2_9BASI|nr:hypothetical protein VP01_1673g1 [Puccinia sorghi]